MRTFLSSPLLQCSISIHLAREMDNETATEIGLANVMKPAHRRQFLHLAAGAAALPALSRGAWAQTYPSRPVRLIVGFGAGTAADIVARLIGQWLSERLGQPFIV